MAEIVGNRFHPTDVEIVDHYIRLKNAGKDSLVDNGMNEVNICAFDPWDLPDLAKLKSKHDRVWFYFSRLDPMSPTSQRTNRTTRSGHWKPTGVKREIREKGMLIGVKKTLVFYRRGQKKGTNWVMHEYHGIFAPPSGRAYVVCKLKCKEAKSNCISSSEGGESSRSLASTSVNLASSSNVTAETYGYNPAQATPESFINFGELDYDFVEWGEIAQFCNQEMVHPDGMNSNLVQPISDVTMDDQEFMEALEFTDPTLVGELFANPDEFYDPNPVFHTNRCNFMPQQSVAGEYSSSSDSDSDTDTGTNDTKDFEVVGSPVESVDSSKGSSQLSAGGLQSDEIQKMDTTAAVSVLTNELSGETETRKSEIKAEVAATSIAVQDQSNNIQISDTADEGSTIIDEVSGNPEAQRSSFQLGEVPNAGEERAIKPFLIHFMIVLLSLLLFVLYKKLC